MSRDLKKQFEENYIPALERMRRKEIEHFKWLKGKEHLGDGEVVSIFIKESQKWISYFEKRIEEYKKYAQQLK